MRIIAVLMLVALGYAQDGKNENSKKKPQTPRQKALALVDKGRALILKEDTQSAIDHLQKAIGQLQRLLVKGLAGWLPEKFADWTRGEVKTDSGSWGAGGQAMQWNQARCVYVSPDGRLKLDATVSTSPQQIAGTRQMASMYLNPEMVRRMNNNPNMTIASINADGWVGWSVVQKGREVTLVAMTKKVMLSLRIKSDDVSLVNRFWEIFDRKGCAAANK